MIGVPSISQVYWAATEERATAQPSIAYSWKAYFMLTGTVAAVAGLAASIYINATLQAAVFGGLAIVTTVAFYYMRQFADLSNLAETADHLRKTNASFVKAQKRLETVNGELKIENSILNSANTKLKKTADSLKKTNRDLQETEQKIAVIIEALRKENLKLRGTNQQLVHQVETLQQAILQINGQVTEFNAQNIHLGQSLGIFKEDSRDLGALKLELDMSASKLNQILHTEMQALANEIQAGQGLVTQFCTGLQTQNTQLQKVIAELSDTIKKGNLSKERLQQLEVVITESERNIALKSEQLAEINQQLADALGKFKEQNLALIGVNQKLADVQGELRSRESAFSELKKTYQQILQKFEILTRSFEEKVTQLEESKHRSQEDDQIR